MTLRIPYPKSRSLRPCQRIRASILAALGIVVMTASAGGQTIPTCFDCTLGLYDEPDLVHQFGDIVPGVPKTVYLGVKYASPEAGLAGIEFSISGLHSGTNIILMGVESLTDPPAVLIIGSPIAPADTSATSTGTGGADVAWGACIAGSQALLQLRLLTFEPISNHVLRIMHRFPPTNPNYLLSPVLARCDAPNFTAVRVTGLEYTLNGVVSVEGNTWSGMKQLYR